MATNQVKPTNMEAGPLSMNKPTKSFFTSQIILRTVAVVSALSATLIMITNKQSISLFGLQITAKYTDSSAFRFLVGVNAVAFVYSLLSLAFGFLLKSPLCKPGGHLFLLFDLIMVCLVMAGSSAATAIAYVAKNGDSHTGWVPICDNLHTSCERAGFSMFCSFASFFALFLLTLFSAFGLPYQL
ncbi:hypothetical protein AMTRI_Chr06g192220 [Amborella trichopoda]